MRHLLPATAIGALAVVMSTGTALAGKADVVAATVELDVSSGDETFYSFSVTVRHDDEGWDHYADRFEILAPDGSILGTRVLAHPHENEQPFTRSLGAVAVPEGVSEVMIRAHDSVHGHGGKTMTVAIPER